METNTTTTSSSFGVDEEEERRYHHSNKNVFGKFQWRELIPCLIIYTLTFYVLAIIITLFCFWIQTPTDPYDWFVSVPKRILIVIVYYMSQMGIVVQLVEENNRFVGINTWYIVMVNRRFGGFFIGSSQCLPTAKYLRRHGRR